MNQSLTRKGIIYLKGSVKHYDWGGYNLIPTLLKMDNSKQEPFAEYWMGTHPLGESIVEGNGEEQKLVSLAGQLPFLFKILDVKNMLSIQVHPSKSAAEKEFARENAEGIPIDSPNRNYKDDNHKPELMVALGDFWLLHGFKPAEELVYTLLNVVELRELLPIFNRVGYAGLYKYIMELPQEEVNRILKPLLDNIPAHYEDEQPDKFDEDFWATRAAATFNRDGNIDRGIFSIYLFNLVHLKKGEGIFQDAGVPHAYLEGQNVEIMANSDNVLRGGLTTKHIDVKELLKHVKCEPTVPKILMAEVNNKGEKMYNTPVDDFQLGVFELKQMERTTFTAGSTEILAIIEGRVELEDGTKQLILGKGHPSAVSFPGVQVTLRAIENATLFRAFNNVHRGE